jgi:ATP-dependent Clp protease protease subunit
MKEIGKEFFKYAKSLGLNSLTTEDVIDYQVQNVIASNTPYIIEERQLNISQLDVFSRLMMDRILFITGTVNQRMADVTQAQLLFLESIDKKRDITMQISSPGGSVLSGLSIVDVMNYIAPDVATVNLGMAASMGSVLLSAGAKGKRSSLIFSKVMIHHVSSGTSGVIDSQRVSLMESEKYNYLLFRILAENCGKSFEEVHDICIQDKWLNSQEALDFGIIDEIIGTQKNKSIEKYMEGFHDYYDKYVLGKSPIKKLKKNSGK